MNTLKLIGIFILLGFCSCGQTNKRQKTNPEAIKLCTEASKLTFYFEDSDSSKKALNLLDSATLIDSNYYLGHFNKLAFLNTLKLYDRAITTVGNLIRLTPNAHDIYIVRGIFSEKIGDTISSSKDFSTSLEICNKVLDTMNLKHRDFEMITMNKGVNLILLNRSNEANVVLLKLSKTQSEGELKNITLSMINSSKKKLIDKYYSDLNSH
jgi:tetratricopeptide (TPR) repeat protein